jgi:hypothetical protein
MRVSEHSRKDGWEDVASDQHVRVIRFPDGVVVFGALTIVGLLELTKCHNAGTYANVAGFETRVFPLAGDGDVYMIQFVPEKHKDFGNGHQYVTESDD